MKKPHPSNLLALGAGAIVLVVAVVGFVQQVQEAPPPAAAPAAQERPQARAERLCLEQVQQGLKFPSSFSLKLGSMASAPATNGSGDYLVRFSYSAKNALGAELPQAAECIVKANGLTTATTEGR